MGLTSAFIIILSMSLIDMVQPDDADCEYLGDMKDVSLENCISPMLVNDEMYTCAYLAYTSLYASRGDAELWVNVTNLRYYAKNPTFSVYRHLEGDDRLSLVKSCASFTLNSTCLLPSRNGAWYVVVAPYKKKGTYCKTWLQEYPAVYPNWCENEDEAPCLDVENGVLTAREVFTHLRMTPLKIPTDFLFFDVPTGYLAGQKADNNRLIKDIKGVTINGTTINVSGKVVRTSFMSQKILFNVTAFLKSTKNPRCAFFRMERYDIEFSKHIICFDRSNEVETTANTMLLIVVLGVSISVVLILVAAVLLWRNCCIISEANKILGNKTPDVESTENEPLSRETSHP